MTQATPPTFYDGSTLQLRLGGVPAQALIYLSTVTTPGGATLVHYRRVMEALGSATRIDSAFRKQIANGLERRGFVQTSGNAYRITRAGLIEVQRLHLEQASLDAERERVRQTKNLRAQRDEQQAKLQSLVAMMMDMRVSGPRQGYVAGGAANLPDRPRRDGLQHEALPSRRGNKLHYRDGRVVDLTETHHALPTQRPTRLRAWDLQQIAPHEPAATARAAA